MKAESPVEGISALLSWPAGPGISKVDNGIERFGSCLNLSGDVNFAGAAGFSNTGLSAEGGGDGGSNGTFPLTPFVLLPFLGLFSDFATREVAWSAGLVVFKLSASILIFFVLASNCFKD